MMLKIDQTTGSTTPLRAPDKGRTGTARRAGQPEQVESGPGGSVRQFPPAAGDETFNAEKVAAIREDILAGRYRIDPERIADKLLASLRAVIAPKQG